MIDRTFKTYQKPKGKKLSLVSLVILCGLVIVFLLVLINAFFQTEVLESIYKASALLFLMIFGYIVFKSYNQQEKLRGEITGTLELLPSCIVIDQRSIALNEIGHLSIKVEDFEGKGHDLTKTQNSLISNGLNNILFIHLTSKEIIQTNFEQQYEGQFAKINKEILIEYCKAGVLSLINLLEILEIEDYDEIQDFKRIQGIKE